MKLNYEFIIKVPQTKKQTFMSKEVVLNQSKSRASYLQNLKAQGLPLTEEERKECEKYQFLHDLFGIILLVAIIIALVAIINGIWYGFCYLTSLFKS